jgi:signal peptidase
LPDRFVASATTRRWAAPGASGVRGRSSIRSISGVLIVLLAMGVGIIAIAVAVLQLRLSPVLSGSMRPGVQPGDLAVTRQVPLATIQVGDVISFYPPDKTVAVLHRLLTVDRREDGTWITTQGDANPVADPWGEVRLRGETAWRQVANVPLVGFIPMLTQGLRGPLLMVAAVVVMMTGALSLRSTTPAMHPHAPVVRPHPSRERKA